MTADSAAGRADAGAFLHRLMRLSKTTVVRTVAFPSGSGVTLWAPLPWDVLVTRSVEVDLPLGVHLAGDLLALLEPGAAAPTPMGEAGWRWPLPASSGEIIEVVPARQIRQLGLAAAQTLRNVIESGISGRQVGSRALRDALLDHVAIIAEVGSLRVEVPQRLVQAAVQMGFVPSSLSVEATVSIRRASPWVGLATDYGTAWWRPASRLTLTPRR